MDDVGNSDEVEEWNEVFDEHSSGEYADDGQEENDRESDGEPGEEGDGGVEFDEFGLIQFNAEEAGDLSADEGKESRLLAAGFGEGVLPAPWETAILKGTTFKSWKMYDEALFDYEARSGYRFKRTGKRVEAARAICRGWNKGQPNSCKVEISARCMKKTGKIEIRKVFLIHTCSTKEHKFRAGSNRSSWVASNLLNHVRINPNTPVHDLKETMRTFHDAQSERWTVQRARTLCREQISGGSKETFRKIPAYVAALRKVDPECHAFYQTGEDNRFTRIYIAPGSSRNAAKFCRPLVGLDGTHTSGRFPMTLLFATCFDAENHIVILAWALVKVENGDNWCWFLSHFRLSYPCFQTSDMVIISDRDKGLKLGVGQEFPDCHHAHCVQHLRTNIKGTIDVHCSIYFKKIVSASTKEEYEMLLTDFQPANEKQLNFVSYVRKINPEVYARFAFPGRRYGHFTSNVVEIINQAIKPCRVLPALHLCNYLWCYIMERHCDRSEHANELPKGPFALTQYATNILNRLYRESQGVRERKSSSTQSLMICNRGSWAVSLQDRHCDCGDWKEYEFPCIHAIRLLNNRQLESKEYIGEVWLASSQIQAYSLPVPPLSIERLVINPEQQCLEPLVGAKKKGKQSAKRKPSWGEQQARNSQRLVSKQEQRCRRCGRSGHNARGCSYAPPESVTAPVGSSRSRSRGPSHARNEPTHETIRVGDTTAAQRANRTDPWNLYHVRSSAQIATELDADDDGTGPPQATQ